MSQASINSLSLSDLAEAMRPLAPADPATPANLHTAVAFVVLHRRGWSGSLVSRLTIADSPRITQTIYMCLRWQGRLINARGETFEQMWIEGRPQLCGDRPKLQMAFSVSSRPDQMLVNVADSLEYVDLYGGTNAALDRALLYRNLMATSPFPEMEIEGVRRL